MFFAYTLGEVSDENLFDTQINLLKKFKYWGFNIPENILNISFGVFLIFVSINMFFTSK